MKNYYPLLIILILVYLFWNKLQSFFKGLVTPTSAEIRNQSTTAITKDGQSFDFRMWSADDWRKLKSPILIKESSVMDMVDKLQNSGILVYRDDEIMATLYRINYKSQLSYLSDKFRQSAIPVIKPFYDLHNFVKNKLSEENYQQISSYLNNLPNGF
jgi:hypothetical protein